MVIKMADIKNELSEHEEEMVEVVDLEGELYEKLDELEYDGEIYFALIPFHEDEEDEEPETEGEETEEIFEEFGILKKVEQDGEFFLETIEDDDLHDKIGKMFEERFDED